MTDILFWPQYVDWKEYVILNCGLAVITILGNAARGGTLTQYVQVTYVCQ